MGIENLIIVALKSEPGKHINFDHPNHLHKSIGVRTPLHQRTTANQRVKLSCFNLGNPLVIQSGADDLLIQIFLLCFI